jgi:dihydroorotate dehydrogenase electron transfer subunit
MSTSLPRVARVVSVTDESPRVRTYTLDLDLVAAPGQFVMAWLPGVDEKPFSLVSACPVTLTVARVGRFTEAVHALQAGDRIWIRGPLGRPFTLPERCSYPQAGDSLPCASCLLVAGGYGVAPLYFLANQALAAGWQVDAVIGARTAADVVFAGRFRDLGARTTITTDEGSQGEPGIATQAAARLLAHGAYAALYACGPEPMLAAVEQLALSHRLPAQLSYERYMRCGFGVCGSCARDGWLVCRDGPVKPILWDQNAELRP